LAEKREPRKTARLKVTGDRTNPGTQRLLHLAGLSLISETSHPSRSQASAPLGNLEQNRPSSGTALPLLKLRDHRSIKNIWKKKTVCCGVFMQAKASLLVANPRRQRICTIARPFVLLKS
jgi:hypothetical protein